MKKRNEKKALLVTTVSGFVPQFEMNNVHILEKLGYEIHYASNFHMPSYGRDNRRLDDTGIIQHQIDFCRSPYHLKNRKAYVQLKELMNREAFSLVHCHTPMGGVLGRLAAHKTGVPIVIYTAHGFHFYNGAPIYSWLIYYSVEWFLARYTDQLLCINQEDFFRAEKFPAKRVDYIPGVGIDLKAIKAFENKDISEQKEKRRALHIPEGKKVLLSVGELIPRKNHEVVIRALKELNDPTLCYIICGHGRLRAYLEQLADSMGVREQVILPGYREDVLTIYGLSDLFLLPSLQEGLSVALMEAMARGVPVIASDIRGNRDLLSGKNGILVEKDNPSQYARAIRFLLEHKDAAEKMKKYSLDVIRKYDIQFISQKMGAIYEYFDKKGNGTFT